MLRSFDWIRSLACAATCCGLLVGCNPEQATPAPQGAMDSGKMEPGKMEPGKMEPGKMEPGKMEPGKMEPEGSK